MNKPKPKDLLPVLLLAGLALYLITRPRFAGATGPAPASSNYLAAARDQAKYSALGQAASGLFSFLGAAPAGVTAHNAAWGFYGNAPPDAALDQIVSDARTWQAAYGDAASSTGDPYNPW